MPMKTEPTATETAPLPKFVCPYCGADENGASLHALTHHAHPKLTLAQAKAAALGVPSALGVPPSGGSDSQRPR